MSMSLKANVASQPFIGSVSGIILSGISQTNNDQLTVLQSLLFLVNSFIQKS
jgi:hypothetical protein